MCAGCSAEDRERAESDVRKALGPRADGAETWVVSVVNIAGRWSVTLDGPGIRALACTAPEGRLTEAIRDALQARIGAASPAAAHAAVAAPVTARPAAAPRGAAAPAAPASAAARAPAAPPRPPAESPPPAPAKPAPAAPSRPAADGTYACEKCTQRFRVVFESSPGEERIASPVACPHCWHVNRVPVAEGAAADHDYRAEKA
jgi:hypothetical protein